MNEHAVALILWFLIGCGLTYGFHLITSSFKNSLEAYSHLQDERYKVIKAEVEDLNECYKKFLTDFKDLLINEQKRRKEELELKRKLSDLVPTNEDKEE